ncbi:alpha/beta hydrolase [Glycomyces albidus]|uniref:Alpha/beta hydrolase fold domain-containing protein n=1 Tax=Glycomyces albidus TaxID=2656774 RepID=A0A6L5GEH2_9ACTN|nr:alpha/beta hydrolase [Glycomyces albidus]MQM28119.1 alpha/beta hydrolase fold domain-containing protein [Glycomyces albidus]
MTDNDLVPAALHPQVQAYLDRIAKAGFGALHTFTPEQARLGLQRQIPLLAEPERVEAVRDTEIPSRRGPLRIRIYTPLGTEPGRLPVTMFFHGGGFVLGSLDTHDGLCRSIANGAGTLVVSVDYPLAPEHRFPAAPEACFAATRWAAEHAAEIGGDASRMAVAGDSAGGNLAAVVTHLVRERGGPDLVFQLLIYPDVDFRRTSWSIREFAGVYGNITRAAQDWFMDFYVRDGEDKLNPLVSPLLASDFAGLPSALVITAEFDALRDEGEAYAARLADAGVSVAAIRYPGMIHEFLRHRFDESERARQDAAAALRAAFSR